LTGVNGFGLLPINRCYMRRFGLGGSVSAMVRSGVAAGLEADIQVITGTQRAPLRLITRVAGAAALFGAFTATASAQTGSGFLNNVDPLFAGVLARPANLDNTIQYAASAAANGDIESDQRLRAAALL
jgi:hypothetical protein